MPEVPQVLKSVQNPKKVLVSKEPLKLQDIKNMKIPAVTMIKAGEFENFEDIVLCKGNFGVFTKGIWNGTFVAIKTMEIIGCDVRSIISEVSALAQMKHENIIMIMAACIENLQFHIIMQFFEGFSLKDVLFHRTIKTKFTLEDEDKRLIA